MDLINCAANFPAKTQSWKWLWAICWANTIIFFPYSSFFLLFLGLIMCYSFLVLLCKCFLWSVMVYGPLGWWQSLPNNEKKLFHIDKLWEMQSFGNIHSSKPFWPYWQNHNFNGLKPSVLIIIWYQCCC